MDVYESLLALGRQLYPGNEAMAQSFAQGRADSVTEAREQWSGVAGEAAVPSGLWPEFERAVALESAAFNVSTQTARARVGHLVNEAMPRGEAAVRQALAAHRGRLTGRR